jgi:hypothetical protein
VTDFLRNQRKAGQKGRKTPHPTWKNIIFCHFRSKPEGFIFSKIEPIGGFLPLTKGKFTSLYNLPTFLNASKSIEHQNCTKKMHLQHSVDLLETYQFVCHVKGYHISYLSEENLTFLFGGSRTPTQCRWNVTQGPCFANNSDITSARHNVFLSNIIKTSVLIFSEHKNLQLHMKMKSFYCRQQVSELKYSLD